MSDNHHSIHIDIDDFPFVFEELQALLETDGVRAWWSRSDQMIKFENAESMKLFLTIMDAASATNVPPCMILEAFTKIRFLNETGIATGKATEAFLSSIAMAHKGAAEKLGEHLKELKSK